MTILERLRAATGPDYELDIAIFKFQHPEYADYVKGRGGLVHTCDGADQRVLSDVRPDNYTASIDAALGLVERMLPDSLWGVGYAGDRNLGIYQAAIRTLSGLTADADAPTAPLAILTALFAALEAQEKSK